MSKTWKALSFGEVSYDVLPITKSPFILSCYDWIIFIATDFVLVSVSTKTVIRATLLMELVSLFLKWVTRKQHNNIQEWKQNNESLISGYLFLNWKQCQVFFRLLLIVCPSDQDITSALAIATIRFNLS